MSWVGLKEKRLLALIIIGASFIYIFTPTTGILSGVLNIGSGLVSIRNGLALLLGWVGVMLYLGNRI